MWAIEAPPGPKVAYRGGGIIMNPAILLYALTSSKLTDFQTYFTVRISRTFVIRRR